MRHALPLVRTWLLLDFFGDSRRTGGTGSTLTTAIFGQAFLAMVMAGLLYPDVPPVPFAAANLALSTLLVGLGTLGGETGQLRAEADRVLLATAPVRAWEVVLARALHGAFHVVLVTVGMALPPAILLAYLTRDPLRALLYLPCACLLAGLVVGALTLLLQILRSGLGQMRAALISGTARAVLLALGVIAFATCLPALEQDANALPIGRLGAELMPPYQAARFLAAPATEWPRFLLLAGLGLGLLALAALVRDRNGERAEHAGRGRLLALYRRRLPSGPLLGLTEFVATMLYRSPGLRARVLPLLGVPAAMVLMTLGDTGQRAGQMFVAMALQFPAIYLPFVVAFLPRADHPGTAWLFGTCPGATLARARNAACLALVSHVLLPVHVIALLAMLLLGMPWSFAVPAAMFALGIAVMAAERQTQALQTVPFTSATDADEAASEAGAAFGSGLILALLGAGFALAPTALQMALGVLALGLGAHRAGRLR